MSKEKSIATTSIASADRVPDRDNIVRISIITSQKQFRHFTNEVALLLGSADMEKYPGKDAPNTFLSEGRYIYPLTFRVGFKLPLHSIIAAIIRRFNVSPHRVVPNAWRILAAIPTLNARLNAE